MRDSKALSDLGEQPMIQRIAHWIKTDPSVIKGIGDDCAVLSGGKGKYLLFASDMLVQGVHFTKGASPGAIGWKALAVNLSDIAAMGGIPRYAVISLGLPRVTKVKWVDALYRGLRRCAQRFRVNIVGGDTDRSERIVIDVSILGEVEKKRVVYRSGAKPGDALLVTGSLGGAVRSGRHLTFTPRVQEARALGQEARIHAMIDLSDGLGPDLLRLCQASKVAAVLDADSIPRHSSCSLTSALTEGEDFELLLAVDPSEADRLLSWAKGNLACKLTRIGRIVPAQGKRSLTLILPGGRKAPARLTGFEHF